MNKSLSWFVSRITLIIFFYIIIYYFILGLTLNYFEGDSINYHIPIANAFLTGEIVNPHNFKAVEFLKFSPGNNEAIVSILMFLKIPINIFNVIGVIALFLACFYAGRKFLLDKDLSIIFAGSVITLHTMTRWINTQIIDIWFAVWFVLILALLQKPEKTIKYFLILGFSCGMLIGSKYSGPIFLLILFVFYLKKLIKIIDLKYLITFIIPFSLIGLSWYLRNYLITGNPLYPQGFLMFKDHGFDILKINVWRATLLYPNGKLYFVNALISEFGLWSLSIFTPLLLFIKKVRNSEISKLIFIGLLILVIYMFLPSDNFYNIAVSVFRYSYAGFIVFILAIFLLAVKFKKTQLLIIFSLANMIIIPSLTFKPKLIFLLLPIVFIIFYEEEILTFFRNKVPLKAGK